VLTVPVGDVTTPAANVAVATAGAEVEAAASRLTMAKKTQEVTASVKSLGIRCVV
jgi:hypothetical protein